MPSTSDTQPDKTGSLDELLSKQEIREVVERYCRALDRVDVDLMRSCFHPDAWTDFGLSRGDVDHMCATMERETSKMLGTHHLIGQTLIDLDRDGAETETYLVAHHRLPSREEGKKVDLVVGTRYLDLFERRDGRWLISQRTAVVDWSRFDDVGGELPNLDVYVCGQRGDRSDLVYNLADAPRREPRG